MIIIGDDTKKRMLRPELTKERDKWRKTYADPMRDEAGKVSVVIWRRTIKVQRKISLDSFKSLT